MDGLEPQEILPQAVLKRGDEALRQVIDQFSEHFSDRVGAVVEAGDYGKRVQEIHASMLAKIDELLNVIPAAEQLAADYSAALARGDFNAHQEARRLAQLMLLRANVSLWSTLKAHALAEHRKAMAAAAKNRWAIETAPPDRFFFPRDEQLGELMGVIREMQRYKDDQVAPLAVDLLNTVVEFQALDKAFRTPRYEDFPEGL